MLYFFFPSLSSWLSSSSSSSPFPLSAYSLSSSCPAYYFIILFILGFRYLSILLTPFVLSVLFPASSIYPSQDDMDMGKLSSLPAGFLVKDSLLQGIPLPVSLRITCYSSYEQAKTTLASGVL
jgi:hypothetical protein